MTWCAAIVLLQTGLPLAANEFSSYKIMMVWRYCSAANRITSLIWNYDSVTLLFCCKQDYLSLLVNFCAKAQTAAGEQIIPHFFWMRASYKIMMVWRYCSAANRITSLIWNYDSVTLLFCCKQDYLSLLVNFCAKAQTAAGEQIIPHFFWMRAIKACCRIFNVPTCPHSPYPPNLFQIFRSVLHSNFSLGFNWSHLYS